MEVGKWGSDPQSSTASTSRSHRHDGVRGRVHGPRGSRDTSARSGRAARHGMTQVVATVIRVAYEVSLDAPLKRRYNFARHRWRRRSRARVSAAVVWADADDAINPIVCGVWRLAIRSERFYSTAAYTKFRSHAGECCRPQRHYKPTPRSNPADKLAYALPCCTSPGKFYGVCCIRHNRSSRQLGLGPEM